MAPAIVIGYICLPFSDFMCGARTGLVNSDNTPSQVFNRNLILHVSHKAETPISARGSLTSSIKGSLTATLRSLYTLLLKKRIVLPELLLSSFQWLLT